MFKGNKRFRFPSFAPRRIHRSNLLKLNLFVLTYLALTLSLTALYISLPKTEAEVKQQTLGERTERVLANVANLESINTPTPEPTLTPTEVPIPTNAPTPIISISQEQSSKTVSNVENDDVMANANDIFNALNSYRNENGIPSLAWDNTLADFAAGRTGKFSSNNSLDGHVGFREFMNNNGFEKSGFNGLGENSAQLSGPMRGDKIIREIFGASTSHNTSQLDPAWTHVGISANGIFVNVNFGKDKR